MRTSNRAILEYFNHDVEKGTVECKLCKQRLKSNRIHNLKQHLKKIHNEKNTIWKYFDNDVSNGIAECKRCKFRLNNRICNLRLHMRRSHNLEVEQVRYDNVELPSPPEQQPQTENNEKKCQRDTILVNIDKNTIIRSVLGFIVEDRMSVNTICSKDMQAILQPICAAISADESKVFKIDEQEVEHLIDSVANLMRNDFSNELDSRLLSLKIENDVNSSPNTFCLSVMFIDNNQIQKRCLGIIELENGTQLSESDVKNLLHKFNIDTNQIVSAYWDNTKGNYLKFVSNSNYLDEIKNFEDYPNLQLGDIKIERFIGTLAHQCVLDVVKSANVFKQFLECRNLVKFLNDQTNGFHGLFEKNDLTIPQLDSPWKWGSTHQMIQNLYNARSILENIKFEIPDNPEDHFNMDNSMWYFIDGFYKGVNIIQKSILKFYGEELNYGNFYAQWLKCRLATDKLLSHNNKTDSFSTIILTELSKCIKERSIEVLRQGRYLACLYLDPRFQRTLNFAQKSIALDYLKNLWSLAELYNVEIAGKNSENLEGKTSNQSVADDEDEFLNEYLSQNVQIKDTKTADVFKKIQGLKLPFQTVDTDILRFWKDQQRSEPEMHALSSICLAIPATQNYCKKMYGDFYGLQHDKYLPDFTKENLVYIRLNAELLTEAVKRIGLCNDKNLNENVSCESENEYVIVMNDDNSSTASSSSTSEVLVTKKETVIPTTSIKTEIDDNVSNDSS